MSRSLKKTLFWLLTLAIIAGAWYFYVQSKTPRPEEQYRFQALTRGNITQTISANGTLNPVTLVNVGTQVSGRVSRIYVDFNDEVKEGQLLLELDDSLFKAQIEEAQGSVNNARAALELAQADEARMRALYEQEYVSRQELDQAVQALKSARAQLETARAQLRRHQTNLDYSIIRSPVSGVVVERAVDVGQTVAASFQTPTLLTIAQDLSKMQIDSSFAEADIGNIKVGQKARFTVDAYPTRTFEGVVKQVRLNPTITSNVVTYNVVVAVDNPDFILLPGMTAYVNIAVASKEDVLLAPNSALRFKPRQDDAEQPMQPGARPEGQGSRKKPGSADTPSGTIYILQQGKLQPVPVGLGITDGRSTEIITDQFKEGDRVVVGEYGTGNNDDGPRSMRMRMF
jgi:HlyD family secretion protein